MFKKVDNQKNRTLSTIWLLSISFFWLVLTLYKARQDILISDIVPVTAYTALILALQARLIFLFKRFAPVLLIVFALGNTSLLYGVFSGDISHKPLWQQSLIYGGVGLLYFVVFDIVRRTKPEIARLIWLPPLLVAAFAVGAIAKASLQTQRDPSLNQTRSITFIVKPNIYFLSFDAMVPPSLGAKLLSIEVLPYVDVLKSHGAYFIPNLFTDGVATKWSLANVLKLVPDDVPNYDRIVTGTIKSPLRAIFSANGYTTHFTFQTSYFGRAKGKFLDQYHVWKSYNICSFLDKFAHTVALFGYCELRENLTFFAEDMPLSYEDYAVADVAQIANDKSRPHFYMQHFMYPGHTPLRYAGSSAERKEFEKTYLQHSSVGARTMNRMLEIIHASDPEAIIFIYGDHGAWISRTTEFKEDPEFFVRDRWGTLGAVIDNGRCTSYLEPPTGQRFQTIARIVASLLTCLNGGKSPIITNVDYGKIRQLEGERFEKYVYE